MTDLAQRYGAPSRLRRPVIVALAALLATAGLVWLAWAAFLQSRPQVQSELASYHVRGEHGVEARFTVVRRDPRVHASCLLRALAADHSVVGELNVPVGPPAQTTTAVRESVRTERRATTVELVGCTTKDQHRPR